MKFFREQLFNFANQIPLPGGQSLGQLLTGEGFRRYFLNTGWMFLGQLVSMVISFFVGAWVARYLGPKNYGLMNFAISFGGLFSFLAGFGIDSVLSRELIQRPEDKDKLLGNAIWIKFFGGLLTILAVNITSFQINHDSFSRSLVLLFSWTYLFNTFGVIGIYFQSQVQSKINLKVQLLVAGVSTILKLLFIQFHVGIIWFTGILVLEAINAAVSYLYLYFKRKHGINWQFDWKMVKSLLNDSWPLMFSIIATSIYYKIDQTILKIMLNDAAVGLYAVAVKLSEVWYFIPNIICASIFPAIVNSRKLDYKIYLDRLFKLYMLMLGMSFIIAATIFIFSAPLIYFLFGRQYAGSIPVLRFYIWSGIPVFLMAAVTQYLIAENRSRNFFVATVCGAVVNLALNFYWIPTYGILGSAWATLISYFVPIFVLLIFKQNREHIVELIRVKKTNFLSF